MSERAEFGRRAGVVLAAALPGEIEKVRGESDRVFELDTDERPSPVPRPDVGRAVVLDADTGRLLGDLSWHAVAYGPSLPCAAWNIGIELMPAERGRGVGAVAQRLLAEHLFATTELDRVEAGTDADNVAEQRSLEKAGFRRDGVVRGAQLRGGVRRDMVLYGMLRSDLEGTAE